MAVSNVSKLYSTEDCKIRAITADPVGGPAVFGAYIDVPGIRQVTMTPQIESKQLRGDNKELDSDSTLVAVEVQWEQAKLSYPALAVLLGGTWSGGVYTQAEGNYFSPFQMTWKTPTSGGDDIGGDVHFAAAKLKITAHNLGTAFEDYQILSATARGVFRQADGKLFEILPHEAATLISA